MIVSALNSFSTGVTFYEMLNLGVYDYFSVCFSSGKLLRFNEVLLLSFDYFI